MNSNIVELVPEMITLNEASKRTGLSYDLLRKMCLRGTIVHIKAGNRYLINWRRLCQYLDTATGDEYKEQEEDYHDQY